MADHVDPATRSRIKPAVRAKDTGPELALRRMVHALGYRYRLHVKTLPSKPDLVFPVRRKTISVHGCFWHRHRGCRYASTPTNHVDFWQAKFDANVARDRRTFRAIKKLGWSTMTVWQCQLKNLQQKS